jgi:hypothetical protein
MSTFQVMLARFERGTTSAEAFGQQSVSLPTPQGQGDRTFKDREVFEGSNYWKRYCAPSMPQKDAFLVIIEDDGTIYSEEDSENNQPFIVTKKIAVGSSYDDEGNEIDLMKEQGTFATFVLIRNKNSSQEVNVKINGSKNAILELDGNDEISFDKGDIPISKLNFDNSDGKEEVKLQIIFGLKNKSL